MTNLAVQITVVDGRYCAQALAVGDTVEVIIIADGVAVSHGGRVIGHITPADGWVIDCVRAGEPLACTVAAIDVYGWPRKRARTVAVEVMRVPRGLWAVADRGMSAVSDVGDRAIELSRKAAALGGTAVETVARSAASSARWTGDNLVARPGRAIGGALGSIADSTVRRPLRRLKRLVVTALVLIFAALVLILLIVVIWRLPSVAPLLRWLGLG